MEDAASPLATPVANTGAVPELYAQLGQITRQLHDALAALGLLPSLQHAARDLPDARSRLGYVSTKTGEAAAKVLALVDAAKAERHGLDAELRSIADQVAAAGRAGWPVEALAATAAAASARVRRVDEMLTAIMLAQDFHDLTGQALGKVVALAKDVEDNLVRLLLQAAPEAAPAQLPGSRFEGPVVDPRGRTDVAANQSEVDDLLASLGF